MLQVLSLTVFALLAARLFKAPRGSWRLILGAAVAGVAASQLLAPGHPLRVDVAGGARSLFWIAVALVPVAAYALMIRRLRRRSGAALPEVPERPRGLVQIAQDAALADETRASLDRETEAATGTAPARLSLGWRAADGALAGHLRLRLEPDCAEVEALHVAPAHRRAGIGTSLMTAAAAEAQARGATRLRAVVADWQAPQFFASLGFATHAELDRRRWMERPLA